MVGEALKGGRLIAEVMAREKRRAWPAAGSPQPLPFITAVEVGSPARMCAFCRAVQRCSPVGSFIEPTPGVRPSQSALCGSGGVRSTEMLHMWRFMLCAGLL
jgi:cystathionine beta-lyase family protein involved in aluminum resistance